MASLSLILLTLEDCEAKSLRQHPTSSYCSPHNSCDLRMFPRGLQNLWTAHCTKAEGYLNFFPSHPGSQIRFSLSPVDIVDVVRETTKPRSDWWLLELLLVCSKAGGNFCGAYLSKHSKTNTMFLFSNC